VLGVFLLLYTPWLLRNWMVCGNPAGIAFYSALDGLGRSETSWMRDLASDSAGITPTAVRDKMINNMFAQTGRIFDYLGWSIVALAFFTSLLHRFRRPETSAIRWMLLVLWGGAVLGMAVFGLPEEQGFSANQLHLLFVPIMTCYGLAWFLVQWNRLGVELRLARIAFVTLLFLLCGLPMANNLFGMLLGAPRYPARWPPYIPPYIAILNEWMAPNEVTASDMPWAIAWYADRPGILVPSSVKTLIELSDYGVIGEKIPALYLTPISSGDNKWRDISHGDYKEWIGVIIQSSDVGKLPYKWGTLALGPEKECTFLADRDRSKPAE